VLAGNTVGVQVPSFAQDGDIKDDSPQHPDPVGAARDGLVDNQVDNGEAARRQATAALLEQAALLARAGASAEAEALLRAAQGLLAPGGAVVALRPVKGGAR
jgi:hypothetical protein